MNLWYALIGLSVASFIGIVGVFTYYQPKDVDQNGCRRDGVVKEHTIVLVDQSDPFTEQDVRWALQIFTDESRDLDRYGRFTLLGLRSSTPYEPFEQFIRCTPGAKANGLVNNPRMVEDVFKREFSDELSVQAEALLEEKSQASSPLLEALVGISDRSDFSSAVNKRRLVLITDLIQNSDEVSHFNSGVDFSAIGKSRFVADRPDLTDVEIAVRVVPRRNYAFPKEKLVKFWEEVFEFSGAQSAEIL